MAKKIIKSKKKITPLVTKNEKVVSASGNTYYRPKSKKKSAKKVVKKVTVKKLSKNETATLRQMSFERLDVRKFKKSYETLAKEVKDLEKQLEAKYQEMELINTHINSLTTIMSL